MKKVIRLKESHINRMVNKVIREQSESSEDNRYWLNALSRELERFHPELKNLEFRNVDTVEYIFEDGKFNTDHMKRVCEKAPTFCKVFPAPEVMQILLSP